MATEDEIDVEGDFELESGLKTSILYDADEPPSKSACLQPEFSQHPWALEQNWSLDHCADERSKAAIEKMLQEEQYYLTGRRTVPVSESKEKTKPNVSSANSMKAWLPQEKKLLRQLLDICGENWDEIALSLPTKTVQQIKTYGQRLLKKKKTDVKLSMSCTDSVDCDKVKSKQQNQTPLRTAQPTIIVGQGCKRNTSGAIKSGRGKMRVSPKKVPAAPRAGKSSVVLSESTVVRIKSESADSDDGSDIEIDINGSDDSESENDRVTASSVYDALHQAAEDRTIKEIKDDHDETHENESLGSGGGDEIDAVSENTGSCLPGNCVNETATTSKVKIELESDVEKIGTVADTSNDCVKSENAADDAAFGDGEQEADVAKDIDEEEEEEDAHPNEFPILKSNGDIVYIPNPSSEKILEKDEITEEEKNIHCEFFNQRPGQKTPDRYLKIRNFILDAWAMCRPVYLNKTSIRPGLRKCGDVNCIGRIHSYLEQIGAINFGCEQVQYNKRPARSAPLKLNKMVPIPKLENMVPRKRRVRAEDGEWVDEKELEGKTIEHREKKPVVKTARKTYDPFKLQPCRPFTDQHQAPYEVTLDASCMVVMDIHAHLWKTEVMGMLGGKYDADEGVLHLAVAEPCRGISTGMQCEMDPVSQTVACSRIMESGYSVLGWYHSHPTFPPNPSVRDLETQQKYQEWFAKGGTPFLGIIVSPYCVGNSSTQSVIQCLVVDDTEQDVSSNVTSHSLDVGMPYYFDYMVNCQGWCEKIVLDTLNLLQDEYKIDSNHIPMHSTWRTSANLSCLQKMLKSLDTHLPSGDHTSFYDELTQILDLTQSPNLFDSSELIVTDVSFPDSLDTISQLHCTGHDERQEVVDEEDIHSDIKVHEDASSQDAYRNDCFSEKSSLNISEETCSREQTDHCKDIRLTVS